MIQIVEFDVPNKNKQESNAGVGDRASEHELIVREQSRGRGDFHDRQ